jgi:hypothetical protein
MMGSTRLQEQTIAVLNVTVLTLRPVQTPTDALPEDWWPAENAATFPGVAT